MEMTGKIDCKMAEPGGGDECRDVLQILGRKEVLEALSEGFCSHCQALLESRINNLIINRDFDGSILAEKVSQISLSNDNTESSAGFWSAEVSSSTCSSEKSSNSLSNGSYRQESGTPWSSTRTPEPVYSVRRKGYVANSSPSTVNSDKHSFGNSGSKMSLNNGVNGVSSVVGNGLSEEQIEHIRIPQVGRKKDFVHIERIHGKATNVLQGLELHTGVFNAEEQKNIVECVYNLQRMGQKGQLRERTYSEPRKWMRGKGRVTIQFGCCYNYAVDRNGNPPGIVRDEEIDPLPPLFKQMIKRMVRWHVLPPTCVPDSCIVNIYDEGDCIPPHIDHHDFLRPFCTVSFLTECNIVFGSILKIVNAGEFSGPVSIPLPVGSVLILNGNGADIAKHCVPAVPAKRISITFRKMDDSKLPYKFLPDPDLQGIKPLVYASSTLSPVQQNQHHNRKLARDESKIVGETRSNSFFMGKDDFPPLGSSNSVNQQRVNRYGPKQ